MILATMVIMAIIVIIVIIAIMVILRTNIVAVEIGVELDIWLDQTLTAKRGTNDIKLTNINLK